MYKAKNTSGRLMLGEIGPDGWYNLDYITGHAAGSAATRDYLGYRHSRKTNLIMVDGHLESRSPLEIPINYLSQANDPNDFYKSH